MLTGPDRILQTFHFLLEKRYCRTVCLFAKKIDGCQSILSLAYSLLRFVEGVQPALDFFDEWWVVDFGVQCDGLFPVFAGFVEFAFFSVSEANIAVYNRHAWFASNVGV